VSSADIAIYVCGLEESGKTTLINEIRRILFAQGLRIYNSSVTITNALKLPENHFETVRLLREAGIVIAVEEHKCSDRILEILNVSARENESHILVEIHWGENCFSSNIFPGRRYLVLIKGKWYTGTFRKKKDTDIWQFCEMDDDGVSNFWGQKKYRYDLVREASTIKMIEKIYEIVEKKTLPDPVNVPDEMIG
jgi:GTPase SAR1 family protein